MWSGPDLEAERILALLVDGGVDFVVIGGVAAVFQGSARNTLDLDIAFSDEPDNLRRLGEVLVGLRARRRGAEDAEGFVPDAATLRHVEVLTLRTDAGDLDVLGRPAGAPRYATLRERADVFEIGGRSVPVALVEDLLAMKRAAGRGKDHEDVAELEAILRLRGR